MRAATGISRFEAVLLAAFFVVAISLPVCKQAIFGEGKTEMIEGRRLNVMPRLSLKHFSTFKEFPGGFDRYYNDHFGFRTALLRMGSYAGVKYANVSLSPDVIIGKEGWLFMKNEQEHEVYSGATGLSDSDLERWRRSLERRQAWLARKGIKFLFVVPPDKQTVYPEFMPDKYSHGQAKSPVEQLTAYLAAHHSGVNMLSLREPLIHAKGRERLYLRQDTHWNTLGAYVGYREIISRFEQWFPEMKPKERSAFRVEMEYMTGDLARMMGVPDYSAGNEPALKPLSPPMAQFTDKRAAFEMTGAPHATIEVPNSENKRRAVIQHDSFMVLLVPLLAEDFSRITFHARGDVDLQSERELADSIRKEKPDVFIEERLERFLAAGPADEKIVFGGTED